MTKAEQRGLEAVPPRWRKTKDGMGKVDSALPVRKFYIRAYEQAQKDLGWISVKERLPEKEGWYLTCSDDNGTPQAIGVTRFDGKGWEDDDDSYYCHVDYWMPIPELPKEK